MVKQLTNNLTGWRSFGTGDKLTEAYDITP